MTDDEIVELINRYEMQMLVHSCLYYRMNTSIWSDKKFDIAARHLATLIKDHPKLAMKTLWHVHFKDWDGTTGYHLPIDHPDIISKAYHLLQITNKEDYSKWTNQQDSIQENKKKKPQKSLEQNNNATAEQQHSKKGTSQTKLF